LRILALGAALLHELRALGGGARRRVEADAAAIGAGRDPAELVERWPGIVDEAPRESFARRGRVVGRHLAAARQEARRPARADGAGADHRNTFVHGRPDARVRQNAGAFGRIFSAAVNGPGRAGVVL